MNQPPSVRLSVNLNKIALIRNARDAGGAPDLMEMARICIQSGAQGITLHPRPDGRHILPEDVVKLQNLLQSMPPAELNIEGNPFSGPEESYPGFIQLIHEAPPHQCTLVPDGRDQLTSDHGWDMDGNTGPLRSVISDLKKLGCRVSLFINPHPRYAEQAAQIGADSIELFTGPWHRLWLQHQTGKISEYELHQGFEDYYKTAQVAADAKLQVNAGHDLNLKNIGLIATLPGLAEVSIGQALIVDALQNGLQQTIRLYLEALQKSATAALL
ncbi:MAG: pyridoxine 5'-phosphate synthase [Gammaproteobacteria bacterium]